MEVPDKRKKREDGPTGNHASYGSGSSNWKGNGNTNGKANGNESRNGNAAYARSGSRPQGRDAVSPVQRGADQRSAIRQSDRRDFEVLDERDEDRLSERRGSGVIRNHTAFSTTGISQTASSSSSSGLHSSGAERTETVAIWKCSSSTCKAWLRQKPDSASAKSSKKATSGPPPCPLCSGTMEASTRKVPVTGRFGR